MRLGTVLVACLVALPVPALTECVDYEDFFRWSGATSMGSTVTGVAVARQYMYVALGSNGVAIVDHTMSPPTIVGQTDTPGPAMDIVSRGGYAYVPALLSGLVTIDATDPVAPFVTDALPTDGYAEIIERRDDFLFVGIRRAAPDGYLTTFRTFNPAFPFRAGRTLTPWWPQSISVVGDRAYVSDAICFEFGCVGGLGVYDITDLFFPMEIGYGGTGPMDGLDMADDIAYLVGEDRGLWIVDASVPNIQQFVFTDVELTASDVGKIDDTLYMTTEGLRIMDVSDPILPVLVAEMHTSPSGFAKRLEVVGDLLYAIDGSVIHTFDATARRPLMPLGVRSTANAARGVAALGDYAYVTDGSGLTVVDVSDPTQPATVRQIKTSGSAMDLVVDGALAYLADGQTGLAIYDLSDPSDPVILSERRGGGFAFDVSVRHPYAYVVETGSKELQGFRVFDVSDPAAPARVDTHSLDDDALGVSLSGNEAFVAADAAGVAVFDVTDPSNAVPLGSLVTAGAAQDVVADGTTVFVADGSAGLTVIDYPNVDDAVWINRTPLPGFARKLWKRGDHLYVTTDRSGVTVFDVSEPSVPRAIGSLLTFGASTDVFAREGQVLIAAGDQGLVLFPGTCEAVVGVDPADVPEAHRAVLGQNHPNPFSPTTRIPFELSERDAVTLRVFDTTGRLVRTLANAEVRGVGRHVTEWDGRDERGLTVAAGTYFYRLETDTFREQRSAVLVR